MATRVLTALVLIPPVAYVIGWGPEWLYLLVLIATVERGLYEFYTISRRTGFKSFEAVGYVACPWLCLAQAAGLRRSEAPSVAGALGLALLVLVVVLTMGLGLIWTPELKQYLGSVSSTILGIIYIGGTLSCLVPLRFSRQPASPGAGRELILFLFLVVCAGDIVAYFIGRQVGRTRLFPRVSPLKTVEGAVGGLAGSLLVAWGFARWSWRTADLGTVMLLAGLVAVAGQIGDFVESALKRGADLKDSGALLPGHGGLLDRIDSLIFSAPALWLALAFKDVWR